MEVFEAKIGARPISKITPSDILEAIRPYDIAGKAETAHVLAQTASQICGYARICGYAQYDAGGMKMRIEHEIPLARQVADLFFICRNS